MKVETTGWGGRDLRRRGQGNRRIMGGNNRACRL